METREGSVPIFLYDSESKASELGPGTDNWEHEMISLGDTAISLHILQPSKSKVPRSA